MVSCAQKAVLHDTCLKVEEHVHGKNEQQTLSEKVVEDLVSLIEEFYSLHENGLLGQRCSF